jgi:3',5'-cyclic AMP phosphodiesterase CpdA
MLRLLHLTDIHFGAENPLAAAAAADYAHKEPFDLLVLSGDVTQDGRPIEFEAAARWYGALPGPKIVTPGNHDIPQVHLARVFDPFGRYEKRFGPAGSAWFDGPGLSVRAFNTARGMQLRPNWSKGALAPGQARAVAADLGKAPPGTLRVAVCHHPLVEVPHGPMTGRVIGGVAGARLLAEAGVDLILSGHVHTPFAFPLPFADERTYSVGAATLSLRERGTPAGFNVIEVEPDCIRVKALAWTGSSFEAARTWALPRRTAQNESAAGEPAALASPRSPGATAPGP